MLSNPDRPERLVTRTTLLMKQHEAAAKLPQSIKDEIVRLGQEEIARIRARKLKIN